MRNINITLDSNLYYKYNLHLIEKGNEKLPESNIIALNVGDLKQQQTLPQFGKQYQQERQHH